MTLLVLVLVLVVGHATAAVHVTILSTLYSLSKVDTKTRNFIDEHGRVRIFHGVNAVHGTHNNNTHSLQIQDTTLHSRQSQLESSIFLHSEGIQVRYTNNPPKRT